MCVLDIYIELILVNCVSICNALFVNIFPMSSF